jgi:serine/threonine-protein kinase
VDQQLIGPYRIEALIGRGGMGEVYRAYDTSHDRVVALKVLPPALAADAEFAQRFRRESQLLARLREPHIIPIHRFGEIDGRLFLDMRLVDGRDLGALLAERGPFPPARAVDIVGQVADALDTAHAEGLVHRDVKPSNVLVDRPDRGRDFVYLVDFGIARSLAGPDLTAAGEAVGTATYMAPERLTGDPGDHRVDVYALGCLLFQTLTGRRPFEFAELPAMMNAHLHHPPPRVSEHAGWAPQQLDDVVARAIAKRPEDRYPSAGELADAARAALASAPQAVGPVLPTPQADDLTERASAPGADDLTERAPAPAADDLTERVPEPDGATVALPRPDPQPPGWQPIPPPSAQRPDAQPPRTPPPHAPPPRRRRRWTVVLAVAVVLAAVAGTVGVLALVRSSATSAPSPPAQAGSTAPAPTSAPTAPKPFTVTATIQVGPGAGDLATSPDGSRVYVVSSGYTVPTTANADQEVVVTEAAPPEVSVIDTATGTVTATLPVPDGPGGIAVAPDGARVYVATFSSTITVIDPTAGTAVGSFPVRGGGSSVALAVSPDGRRIYTTTDERDTVTVLDAGTGETVATVRVGDEPVGVAFSPDGRRAYVPNYFSDTVSVIDTATPAVVATVPVGAVPSGAVAVTPDGRFAYVGSAESISVIDTATNQVTAAIPGGANTISVAPDGSRVYAGGLEGIALIDPVANTVTDVVLPRSVLSQAVLPDGTRGYVTTGSDIVSVMAMPG